jgi:hypothetical protein
MWKRDSVRKRDDMIHECTVWDEGNRGTEERGTGEEGEKGKGPESSFRQLFFLLTTDFR